LDPEIEDSRGTLDQSSIGQSTFIAISTNGVTIDVNGNYVIPAALLAQCPALADLSRAELPQGDEVGAPSSIRQQPTNPIDAQCKRYKPTRV
jgi:hypothetical protein